MTPLLRISHGQDQIEAVLVCRVLDDEGGDGPVEGGGDALVFEGAQRVGEEFRVHRDGEVLPFRFGEQRFVDVAVFRMRIDAQRPAAHFEGDEIVFIAADEDGGALDARKQGGFGDGEPRREGRGDDALLFDEVARVEAGDDGHAARGDHHHAPLRIEGDLFFVLFEHARDLEKGAGGADELLFARLCDDGRRGKGEAVAVERGDFELILKIEEAAL